MNPDRIGTTQSKVDEMLAAAGASVRYDTFAEQKLITWGNKPPHPYTDHDYNDLILAAKDVDLGLSERLFDAAVDRIAQNNSFHPVCDYLDGLKWDGVSRIDSWLTTYCGAKPSKLNTAVGAITLIAAVRRVRRPGCKFDEVPVLISEEGYGKSTALATLCPRPAWFSDSLPLGASPKLVVEGTRGVWLLEAPELMGNHRSEPTAVKAFLSRATDGPVRMSYARNPITRPRQFIIVATTNENGFLRSMQGNRRFWPVVVGRADLKRLERDRDQLWAEAAQREAEGASIRLPVELWKLAQESQERHRIMHPWEEEIRNADLKSPVPTTAVWDLLKVAPDRRDQKANQQLGEIMRKLGWIRPENKARVPNLPDGKTHAFVYRKLNPFDVEMLDTTPQEEEEEIEGAHTDTEWENMRALEAERELLRSGTMTEEAEDA
jgi:predicted P-loop ATPase